MHYAKKYLTLNSEHYVCIVLIQIIGRHFLIKKKKVNIFFFSYINLFL